MAKISTQKLLAGMKVATPVVDPYGNILIAESEELTNKHLRLLKTWGVEEVTILDPQEQGEMAAEGWDASLISNCRKVLLPIFKKANLDHPVMEEVLKQAIRLQLKNQAGKTEGVPCN